MKRFRISKGQIGYLGLVLLCLILEKTSLMLLLMIILPILGAYIRGVFRAIVKYYLLTGIIFWVVGVIYCLFNPLSVQSIVFGPIIYIALYMILMLFGSLNMWLFQQLFNNKNTMMYRTFSGILASFLIMVALKGSGDVLGNPLLKIQSYQKIRAYVNESYSEYDLKIGLPVYDMKQRTYVSEVKDDSIIDRQFKVSYQNGEVVEDTYAEEVESYKTTIERLSKEYTDLINHTLKESQLYFTVVADVNYDRESLEIINPTLSLGMPFTPNFKLPAFMTLTLEMNDLNLSSVTEAIKVVYELLQNEGYHFISYEVSVNEERMKIFNLLESDLEQNDLEQKIEKGLSNKSQAGIYTRIE